MLFEIHNLKIAANRVHLRSKHLSYALLGKSSYWKEIGVALIKPCSRELMLNQTAESAFLPNLMAV
jgi:hypothetical protein